MSSKSKRVISTLLAAALVLSLSAAFPLTASSANSVIHTIKQTDAVSAIQGTIHWELDHIGDGDSITIVGSKTDANDTLTLNIPNNKTVIWEANYRGSISAPLITLTGGGAFEAGADIENTGSGHAIHSTGAGARITVYNCCIEAQQGNAIRADGQNTSITVGSNNSSLYANGDAIRVDGSNSKITVSDSALVFSKGPGTGSAIYIAGSSANTTVTVTGGSHVRANGTTGLNHAVCSDGANTSVQVSGGHLYSFGEYAAIMMRGASPSVSLTGGLVFGVGTAVTGEKGVIYMSSGSPAYSDSGVAIAWKKPSGSPAYTAGSQTDLAVSPSNATAAWEKGGALNCISYAHGSNTGLFPIDGITINAPATPVNPTYYMNIGGMDNVDIATNQSGTGWDWAAGT